MHQLIDSKIRITSPESRDTLFQILQNNVMYLDNRGFQATIAEYGLVVNSACGTFLGKSVNGQAQIEQARIFINTDKFVSNEDLIPGFILHEKVEMWMKMYEPTDEQSKIIYSIPGYSEDEHKYALYEQYKQAYIDGGVKSVMRLRDFMFKINEERIKSNGIQDITNEHNSIINLIVEEIGHNF